MPKSTNRNQKKTMEDKMAEKKKEHLFKARSGSDKSKLDAPVEGCKASEMVLDILNMGDLPEGLELRFAKSYGAHFISRKGRNALGFFDTKNQLVINGIADELEKAGVKGIVNPLSSKNYRAIKLGELKGKDLAKLKNTIARVLGFTGKAAGTKVTAKGKKKKATPSVAEEKPAVVVSTPDIPEPEVSAA